MRIRVLLFIALALALAQTSFGGTISGCANRLSSPITVNGTLYTQFDCGLYNDVSSYTISLTSLETRGGADLADNALGAGCIVVINGDPGTLPDDGTGLYNQNLWAAVLFFAGDLYGGYASDSLTVYWPGAFPTTSDVKSFDDIINNFYGGAFQDSDFFIQHTGLETVYVPDANHEYDIFDMVELKLENGADEPRHAVRYDLLPQRSKP